jgi:hypothetical protein
LVIVQVVVVLYACTSAQFPPVSRFARKKRYCSGRTPPLAATVQVTGGPRVVAATRLGAIVAIVTGAADTVTGTLSLYASYGTSGVLRTQTSTR